MAIKDKRTKQVICIETNEIFDSLKELATAKEWNYMSMMFQINRFGKYQGFTFKKI